MSKRYTGEVCVVKGTYGFIESSSFPKNVFYHRSECKEVLQCLQKGDVVSFEVKPGKNGGDDVQAINIRLEKEGINENY